VNSFDVAYTDELTRALKEIEKSGKVDGLILKSKNPSVFSSGLDLHDLFAQPRSHLELFWRHVQDLWLQLYSSRLPTVAAINGHCLAGGTIIAGACDYRVAVEGSYGIGVTAAKIGLIAPPWFLKMLTYVMGQRNTELALQRGHVFTPQEALGVGLVDKVCSKDMMDEECWKALEPFLTVSAESQATMKLSLRADLIDNFLRSREEDMNNMVNFILKDSVQSNLGNYMEQLKSKAKH
jgi:3,2-trans-enoyl-CoA isomerase